MDQIAVRTFLAVAQLASFSKAAESLRVVQSTVTNRIRDLETEMGCLLFLRNNRSVVLSPAGQHFLEFAQRFISMCDQMTAEINQIGRYRGWLRVGCVQSLFDCHLSLLLPSIVAALPEIAIKITLDHANNLVTKLHEDEIDLCFCYRRINNQKVNCFNFRKDRLLFVCGNGQDTFPSGIKTDQIRHLPILFSDLITIETNNWFCTVFPRQFTFPLEIDVGSRLLPFLRQGMGYSLLPESLVRSDIDAGSLHEIKILDEPVSLLKSYILVNRNSKHRLKNVDELISLLQT